MYLFTKHSLRWYAIVSILIDLIVVLVYKDSLCNVVLLHVNVNLVPSLVVTITTL